VGRGVTAVGAAGAVTAAPTAVVDAHVTIGASRDTSLTVEELLTAMDRCGIARALVAPPEPAVAVRNREGNSLTAGAARRSARLAAYATANPWFGPDAVEELRRAADAGAVALKLDPALQGFDLLDGLADPLVRFAEARGWPVYVRTGTPAHALPLQLAELARRFPAVGFVMGRNGAADFWLDVVPALRRAPNLYGDTAHAYSLDTLLDDPQIGPGRIVFSTDAPYADPLLEVRKLGDLVPANARDEVLGGTITVLLGGGR
jgi:predicted TIM-barrel fold metal-dependent hydrolase